MSRTVRSERAFTLSLQMCDFSTEGIELSDTGVITRKGG